MTKGILQKMLGMVRFLGKSKPATKIPTESQHPLQNKGRESQDKKYLDLPFALRAAQWLEAQSLTSEEKVKFIEGGPHLLETKSVEEQRRINRSFQVLGIIAHLSGQYETTSHGGAYENVDRHPCNPSLAFYETLQKLCPEWNIDIREGAMTRRGDQYPYAKAVFIPFEHRRAVFLISQQLYATSLFQALQSAFTAGYPPLDPLLAQARSEEKIDAKTEERMRKFTEWRKQQMKRQGKYLSRCIDSRTPSDPNVENTAGGAPLTPKEIRTMITELLQHIVQL